MPTLVLYRGEFVEPDALAVAESIPSARSVRISGEDYSGIFLSPEIVDEIEAFVAGNRPPVVPDTVLTTVLFTDIVASTERARELGDRTGASFSRGTTRSSGGSSPAIAESSVDTAGDGFFATFDGPARAIRCAQGILQGIDALGLELRVGVHSGECELHEGKVDRDRRRRGRSRCGARRPGRGPRVSSTVKDLVAGSGIEFEDRGEHELKGVGAWRLYSVLDA